MHDSVPDPTHAFSSPQLDADPQPAAKPHRSLAKRLLRYAVRCVLGFVVALLLYGLAGLGLGWLARGGGARSYVPAENGVTIRLQTNGVHLSLRVPIEAEGWSWRGRLNGIRSRAYGSASHVNIGWGDRDFYLDVPDWSDLTVPVAAKAVLLPTSTAIRVDYWWDPGEADERSRLLVLSKDSWLRLCRFIESSFARDDAGHFVPIAHPGYGKYDEFYEARGSYHLFYTCNSWVVSALDAAGLPAPIWSPFDFPVFWHYPE